MVSLLQPFACCQGRPEKSQDNFERPTLLTSRRSGHLNNQLKKPTSRRDLEEDEGLSPRSQKTVELAASLLPGGRMSTWQRDWCTRQRVYRYLNGRNGNPQAAAQILAQALIWRLEYKDVLTGVRTPKWQTDLRVVVRGDRGHPVIYGCFRWNVPATGETQQHIIDHMAAVMEAASREVRHGATAGDTIMDCHGYRMSDNLNPAPTLALMRMANQPYRDGLRTALVVDAPFAFQALWRIAAPLLPDKTKSKIKFCSSEEAVTIMEDLNGRAAAKEVERIMKLNRTPEGYRGSNLPSEVPPDDEDDDENQPAMGRSLTSRLTRSFSRAATKMVDSATGRRGGRGGGGVFWCCRRRRAD